MQYQDKTFQCVDCGKDFVWTASEQEFYAQKGFTNPPKRCPECRAIAKQNRNRNGGGGGGRFGDHSSSGPRQMYQAVCAQCGGVAMLPFEPRGDKPVYCNNCFRNKQDA